MWNGTILPFEFFSRDDVDMRSFVCKLGADVNVGVSQYVSHANGYL
jgi:hypothetical protein